MSRKKLCYHRQLHTSNLFKISFTCIIVFVIIILYRWVNEPLLVTAPNHVKTNFENGAAIETKTATPQTLISCLKGDCNTNSGNISNVIKSFSSDVGVDTKPNSTEINIMITFTNSRSNSNLVRKFRTTVSSLLQYTTVPLSFYIIGDTESQQTASKIITEEKQSAVFRIVKYDIDTIIKEVAGVVVDMKKFFSYSSNSYYGQSLFFLSIAIHRVSSLDINRVILIDCDLKFEADIKELYDHFDKFSVNNIMGIAHENQPVYRHTFSYYRNMNPGTRVGDPPPKGLTGFNSGVLLLNIDKMKASHLYNTLLRIETLTKMTKTYSFKGHLGDQDFFTLLSMEYEDLFYVLPCSWNRQLCVWWKDKGYEDVFDLYYKCDGKINIYHGNCNTPLPL